MKHTPIEPKHIGCGCCNSAGQILAKDHSIDVGFGVVYLYIQYSADKFQYREFVGSVTDYDYQLSNLEEEYADDLKRTECSTLHFNTPLHDEMYEYNREDGQWYLIKQGMGFA